MERVAIVVLNWNGIADTLDCIDSLRQQTYKPFTIVIVDNGSNDNSCDLLDNYNRGHDNSIQIIHNTKNLGFTGGVNTGIKWAIKNGYDYVALFNNDAIADKKWLQELVDAIKSKEIGITTGLLLLGDGKEIDCTGEQYSNWGLPFPRDRNHKKNKASSGGLVFGASGGASLYKIKMLNEIGLFDESFFAYYEDVDISFRAQLAGWKVAYTPKAIAYHKQGATADKISGFAVYQTFKNLPLLYIKNVPRGLLFQVGIRIKFAYWLMFAKAIIKGDGVSAMKGMSMSIVLAIRKLGERHSIQNNKKVTTEYIQNILWKDLPPEQTGLRKLRRFFTGKC